MLSSYKSSRSPSHLLMSSCNTAYSKNEIHIGLHKIHIHKNELTHSEMGILRQNAIQTPVKLFKKFCNYIMLHYTTSLNSSANLPSNSRPTYNCNVATEVSVDSKRCRSALPRNVAKMPTDFCETVCKTVRPMLSDRCLSCLSCPVLRLVYCGQTV